LLPPELLSLPEEPVRVDVLVDDPVFFAPFARCFHPVVGRPLTPVERYLRLMSLKFRYGVGFECLYAEISDSISWLAAFLQDPAGWRYAAPNDDGVRGNCLAAGTARADFPRRLGQHPWTDRVRDIRRDHRDRGTQQLLPGRPGRQCLAQSDTARSLSSLGCVVTFIELQ
jgi:hypothetical protein